MKVVIFMAFSYKPLWKVLIDKDMTREGLRRELGISSSTLARMRQNDYVNLKIISDICRILACTPNDIIEYVADGDVGH